MDASTPDENVNSSNIITPNDTHIKAGKRSLGSESLMRKPKRAGMNAPNSTANVAEDLKEKELGVDFDNRTKKYVSADTCRDMLLDAIGVRVGWEDIVECMRGVMDAMRDMNKLLN